MVDFWHMDRFLRLELAMIEYLCMNFLDLLNANQMRVWLISGKGIRLVCEFIYIGTWQRGLMLFLD